MIFRITPLMSLVVMAFLSAGCTTAGTAKPAYQTEHFSENSPFQHALATGPLVACHLGRKALLSQGYLIENSSSDNVRGTKYFQPENNLQLQLDIKLVCMPSSTGSMIYANAVQTRYELKTSASNTGLSVSGIGSISLPWTAEKDSLIKVGEETISDPDFYARFFGLLEKLTE